MDMYKLNQIPSETKIKMYLRRILYGGKNMYCPECRSRLVYRYEDRYRCKKCRCKFSLLSHTWLSSIRLPLQQLWLLLWCWCNQVPVRQTASLTGLSRQTVYNRFKDFRTHIPYDPQLLEDIVQLDEAYGKGWLVLMGKQAGTRKLGHIVIKGNSANRGHALGFLQTHVKPGAQLNTDGALIYKGIHNWWPVEHKVDIHKRFEFGQTSEQEGMFGVMRTFIRRMYHHITVDTAEDYVSEFCARFSSPDIFESPLKYLEKTLTFVPRA